MYAILLKYDDREEFLGIGVYRKYEKHYLVLGSPRRKYKTFEQARDAVVAIKNGDFVNGDFKEYEIVNV